jgi:predicted site-specific integrase-resolvase
MPPPRERDERHLDEVLSLTQAAAERGISLETLRSLIRRGRLKAVRLSERKRGMTRREAQRGLSD